MINVVNWETAHLCGTAFAGQHRLRYRLFVERQHYDVPSYGGMEYDQFDTPAATYLVSPDTNGSGEARGIARLIPTNRPYMIKELWPELVKGEPLPCSDVVYEASRFGIDDRLPAAAAQPAHDYLVDGVFDARGPVQPDRGRPCTRRG